MADTRPEPPHSREELNPLLNPILEQNLSQWAKVYFTTPPEGRDQAVRDLLRQLRVEVGPTDGSNVSAGVPPLRSGTGPADSEPSAHSITCSHCHSENAPEQQFCGFCGEPFTRAKAAELAPQPERRSVDKDPSPAEPLSFLGLNAAPADKELEFLREKSYASEYYDSEPASRRGWYALAAAVIVVAGVTYMEWPTLRRHLQSVSQSTPAVQAPATSSPAPPPAASSNNAPPAVPSQTQRAANPEVQPEAANVPPSVSPEPPVAAATQDVASDKIIKPARANQPSKAFTRAARTESIGPAEGNQELLLAQRYLDGRGVFRDSRQAAALLWKAVAKQNTQADVVLADLYLRGDGVTKSCDQAKLLLTAAARKNAPAASEKLRSLEHGGCK